jgi:hypothetical protein
MPKGFASLVPDIPKYDKQQKVYRMATKKPYQFQKKKRKRTQTRSRKMKSMIHKGAKLSESFGEHGY